MIKFSEQKIKEVEQIIQRYPEGKHKSALLPVLHLAQEEFGGWLSADTMDYVASVLNLQPIEVLSTSLKSLGSGPAKQHLMECLL